MGFSRVHHVTVWLMGWQSPCVEVSVYMYTGDYVSMFCVCMFMCVCVCYLLVASAYHITVVRTRVLDSSLSGVRKKFCAFSTGNVSIEM